MPKSKSFSISVSKQELELYQDSVKENKELEFIEPYIKANSEFGVGNNEDVYSLILNAAILHDNKEIVTHILSLKHTENIFVNTNNYNYSPLSLLLYTGNPAILATVNKYLEANKNSIIRSNPTLEEDKANILEGVIRPKFEGWEMKDYFKYLENFYDSTSITELAGEIELDLEGSLE